MHHLGTCMSIGFQDIDKKRKNIIENREYYLDLGIISIDDDEYKYISPLIDLEIKMDLHKIE